MCEPIVAALVVKTVISPDELTVSSLAIRDATPVAGKSLF